jgi:hypothetical protein
MNVITAVAKGDIRLGDAVSLRKRTWVERWLSWPWKPWVATQVVPFERGYFPTNKKDPAG